MGKQLIKKTKDKSVFILALIMIVVVSGCASSNNGMRKKHYRRKCNTCPTFSFLNKDNASKDKTRNIAVFSSTDGSGRYI
jgi:hypothetical protein